MSTIDIKPNSQVPFVLMSHSTSSFNVSGLKEIPKLTSGNIVSWKQALKVHLKMNGLYLFVETSQNRPDESPDCDTFDMRHGSDDGFTAANTLTELFSSRYNSEQSMTEYLAKTQALHSRFRDLTSGDPDLKISDKLFAVVLVNSLPRAKFGTVIQQLLASTKTLSTSQVIARL